MSLLAEKGTGAVRRGFDEAAIRGAIRRRVGRAVGGVAAGLVAVGGILATAPAEAQELREAVATAVHSHPLVAANKAGYRAARQGVEVVKGEFLPSLDLTADTGYQNADRPSGSGVDENLYRHKERIELTQLLFDGFGTANRARSARATAGAAQFEALAAANQIARRAIEAYLNVVRDRQIVEAAIANIERHNRILGDVEEAARTGGGSEARVAQVKTRLFNAQSQRRRAEGTLRNSESAYVEAVGQAPGTLQTNPVPPSMPPDSIEAALAEALKTNPAMLSSIEEERATQFTAEAERSAYWPTLDVELAHERRDGVDGEDKLETDSTALLVLSWNFYKGGSDRASVRRALERSSEAMYRIHEIDRQIRRELEVAMTDYLVARDQVVLLRDRVATAEEVARAYVEQFRLGQRTLIELLDSGNELFLAQTDLISREAEHLLAAYEFLAVKGTLLGELGITVAMDDAPAAK